LRSKRRKNVGKTYVFALFNTENSLCEVITKKKRENTEGKAKEKATADPTNCCSKSRRNLKVIK